ncbi:phage N-6-adenine-methyltransferase [Avibacterium sp. 21-595]|uniref:phage N-6-adenine-methyltransferase n=1 Tax=Avibacterium sp. 21-595 TaxID=2911527 RepID=UPI002026B0DB|nr:phage N-6-adenine-methyltransferase [Avibacterium sp. 21-595]URL05944.1 phage N-6-adenine-methyltransferase [Avibacterium sp. 21-595]
MNKSNTEKQDKDLWATPWWVFWFAEAYFGIKFDLDVCAMAHNKKVKKYISPEQNTLITEWNGRFCWCNPPYSNPLPFVMRAIQQSVLHNKTVVMLLNVDNSTKWFNQCVRNAKEIVYITDKRIPFINNETGKETDQNNKGQMLVLFAPNNGLDCLKTSYISMLKMREIGNQWGRENGLSAL